MAHFLTGKVAQFLTGFFSRSPQSADMANIRSTLQQALGERGFLIANKGKDADIENPDPLTFTDEDLVVVAVMHAVLTGRPVTILTKDEDIAEQLFRLSTLLEFNYRGMWLAESYRNDPSSFQIFEIPWSPSSLYEERFQKCDESYLISAPQELLDDVLPAWDPVPVSCFVAGDTYMSIVALVAETGMRRLFEVKSATQGLNTANLEGRNCHIRLGPFLPLPATLREVGAVVVDKRWDYDDAAGVPVSIPLLDVDIAMSAEERVRVP